MLILKKQFSSHADPKGAQATPVGGGTACSASAARLALVWVKSDLRFAVETGEGGACG